MIKVDNYIINEDDVESILNVLKIESGKLDHLERVAKEDGVQFKITCPSHNGGHEQKPSCYYSVKLNRFHCFSCGTKGDLVKLVSECLMCSIAEAKSWLKKYGTKTSELVIIDDPIFVEKKTSKYRAYVDGRVMNNYQNYCPYLEQRGITRETAKYFEIKYDQQTKWLVFPCYDVKGNLVMMHKRNTLKKEFYLDAGIPKPVFGIDKIVKNNITTALVTEGPFDAMKAYQFGMPAMATLGMLDDNQINEINNSKVKILYLAMDNDAAGRSFTAKLKRGLKKSIILYEVRIPNNKKDIGELSYEEFQQAIKNAI